MSCRLARCSAARGALVTAFTSNKNGYCFGAQFSNESLPIRCHRPPRVSTVLPVRLARYKLFVRPDLVDTRSHEVRRRRSFLPSRASSRLNHSPYYSRLAAYYSRLATPASNVFPLECFACSSSAPLFHIDSPARPLVGGLANGVFGSTRP